MSDEELICEHCNLPMSEHRISVFDEKKNGNCGSMQYDILIPYLRTALAAETQWLNEMATANEQWLEKWKATSDTYDNLLADARRQAFEAGYLEYREAFDHYDDPDETVEGVLKLRRDKYLVVLAGDTAQAEGKE